MPIKLVILVVLAVCMVVIAVVVPFRTVARAVVVVAPAEVMVVDDL